MKKFIFILMALTSIWACQPKENTNVEIPEQVEDTIPSPPEEVAPQYVIDYDTLEWLEVGYLDPSIPNDLRYATANNFVGDTMYDCGRCFMRPEAAKAVVEVHRQLKEMGYGGLKMFDCYRPRPYQQRLWDKVPDPRYVTPPSKGSMHGRGLAVDLTILDQEGNELDMGTDFDFFGREAYHIYKHENDTVQANRDLLKGIMTDNGFKHITTEWWHYAYIKPLKRHPVSEWVWPCVNE